MENRNAGNESVRDWCGSLHREELLARCFAAGAPAGPLNSIADVFGDRQFHSRRNLVAIDEPDIGETVIVPSVMPRLSVTPGRIKHLGPKLGQNTDEVLSGLLGLEPQEIEELRKKRVI